jgi:hypothetical protein
MRTKERSEIGNHSSGNEAQELVRDWEFLFWAFLVFGLGRLVWMYCARPENSGFHLGLACGFVFCGVLGFAMRWALNPMRSESGN